MLSEALFQEIALVSENSPAIDQRQILRRIRRERHRDEFHAAFVGQAISLEVVATPAGSHHILPSIGAPSRYRRDVVSREARGRVSSTAIHASMAVTRKQGGIGD